MLICTSPLKSETFDYLQKFSMLQDCKKKLKEKFISFEQGNDNIAQFEMKLTEDVFRQIIETRKLNEFLVSMKSKAKDANNKIKKDKKEVEQKQEITFYELVNFMNKLAKESICFTISNPNAFKQITRIHKWLIMEESYIKNFGLKTYEANQNVNTDQIEKSLNC